MNMIKERNEINSIWYVITIIAGIQSVQPVRNRVKEREREKQRGLAHAWQMLRELWDGQSEHSACLSCCSGGVREDSPTHAHTHASRAAHARQGSADTRWQWYAWDRKSVWKLYHTHPMRICGLISSGNLEYVLFPCIIPNVFCIVCRQRVSELSEGSCCASSDYRKWVMPVYFPACLRQEVNIRIKGICIQCAVSVEYLLLRCVK